MNKKNKHIDKLAKDLLFDAEMQPPAFAWDKIEKEIVSPKKKKKMVLWIAASWTVLIVLASNQKIINNDAMFKNHNRELLSNYDFSNSNGNELDTDTNQKTASNSSTSTTFLKREGRTTFTSKNEENTARTTQINTTHTKNTVQIKAKKSEEFNNANYHTNLALTEKIETIVINNEEENIETRPIETQKSKNKNIVLTDEDTTQLALADILTGTKYTTIPDADLNINSQIIPQSTKTTSWEIGTNYTPLISCASFFHESSIEQENLMISLHDVESVKSFNSESSQIKEELNLYSTGITVSKIIAQRLKLSTGSNYTRIKINEYDYISLIEIPLKLNYYILNKKKFDILINGGIVSSFGSKTFTPSTTSGIQIAFPLYEEFQFSLEPNFKYYLIPEENRDLKNSYLGLEAGLKYTF